MLSEQRDHLPRLRSFPSDNLLRFVAAIRQASPKAFRASRFPWIAARDLRYQTVWLEQTVFRLRTSLSRHLHETSRRQFPHDPGFPTRVRFPAAWPAPSHGDKGMSAERHPCDNSCSCFNYRACGMRSLGVLRTLGGSFTIAFKEGPIARQFGQSPCRNTPIDVRS